MTYYDEISEGYEELHGQEQLRKANLIANELSIDPSDSLLDIGCGTASYLEIFNCTKTGIDPSAELLKRAKISVVQGSAENLPFPDNSFDIVISLTAVHNFSDIKKGLEEIKRVAKRDVALSILKKSQNFEMIEQLINSLFNVVKRLDDPHDIIFIAKL